MLEEEGKGSSIFKGHVFLQVLKMQSFCSRVTPGFLERTLPAEGSKMTVAQTQRKRKGIRFPKEGRRSAYVQALEKNHEELELQNQSLLQAQLELETSRDHYVELFDSAPVCFVTLTHTGIIREINLPGVRLLNSRQHSITGLPFIALVAGGA